MTSQGDGLFSLRTLRAMRRGCLHGEYLDVTFVQGRETYAGPVVGIGSMLCVRVGGRLVEDIRPNQVIAASVQEYTK